MRWMRIAGVVVGCSVALAAWGCTWVPMTEAGGDVRLLQDEAATDCQKISTINARTADRIGVFGRSERKVREELEALARNDAAEAGGNAIMPIGTPSEGRQSFVVYRCQ